MKKIILSIAVFGIATMNAQTNIQNAARYLNELSGDHRGGPYDGTYIHGVDNSGDPAPSGDRSFKELPLGIGGGVYSWWNDVTSVGEPSDDPNGAAIGFGNGLLGSAEIWAGSTNTELYSRFLRFSSGWSSWNEIWTANSDGTGSGLDADTVDGLQPVLLQSSGNVGIGTTTPDSKLTVVGNIHAQEVKVTISAGADFVFNDDYKLPSLKEVEQFIKTNNHLPEIASEKEMLDKGLLLAEMNIKLLQKIEELTLYTIEQQKLIDEQAKTIKANSTLIIEIQTKLNSLKDEK